MYLIVEGNMPQTCHECTCYGTRACTKWEEFVQEKETRPQACPIKGEYTPALYDDSPFMLPKYEENELSVTQDKWEFDRIDPNLGLVYRCKKCGAESTEEQKICPNCGA